MRRGILERKELYDNIVRVLRESVRYDVLAIIVFGSSIYFGRGKDIDIIVVVSERLSYRDKIELEYKIRSFFLRRGIVLDVHVLDIFMFKENLRPGTFLCGLALGYEIIYAKDSIVEDKILCFLKKLSEEKYVFHNKYGTWNLTHHARITYKRKTSQKKLK